MKRLTAVLLALCLAVAGCAEGGSRGTGISAFVAGNVASVTTVGRPARASATAAAGMEAATPVEGIQVMVEGTNVTTVTDADGTFSLRGGFEGVVTLVFQRPGIGLLAHLEINVPAGGILTLTNVHIDTTTETATVDLQEAQFDGIIISLDCAASTTEMRSVQESGSDADQYTVLLDTCVVRNSNGKRLTCADLSVGQRAIVHTEVSPDGTFGNGTIDVVD